MGRNYYREQAEQIIRNRRPIEPIVDRLPPLPDPYRTITDSKAYHFKWVRGHIEAFDKQGRFQYSADTMHEARQELA